MNRESKEQLGLIYLLLVPVLTALLGFLVGHVSYTIYLPVWIINVFLMISASKLLGLDRARIRNDASWPLAFGAFFLIIPWMLFSMFAGLGPPPGTAAEWAGTSPEQQARYFMLITGGVSAAIGFLTLCNILRSKGESTYSIVCASLIILAVPLFIVNMTFWGRYLPEFFKQIAAGNTDKLPEWFGPVRKQFGLISVVEVALTFLATSALAVSMFRSGFMSKTSSRICAAAGVVAALLAILSEFLPEPFVTFGNIVSIPAFPFLIPYYIGVVLLKSAGEKS